MGAADKRRVADPKPEPMTDPGGEHVGDHGPEAGDRDRPLREASGEQGTGEQREKQCACD